MTGIALPAAGYFNSAITNGNAKDAQDAVLAFIRQSVLGGSAETELTIASGSVTPTGTTHSIDTEANAATDDLTNIVLTNMVDGQFLLVRAEDIARVTTLKNQAGGSGQMKLRNGADVELDALDKWIMFKLDGTTWEEVTRSASARPVLSKTANYTVDLTDDDAVINVDASAGDVVIAVTSAPTLGKSFRFRVVKTDSSLHTVTIEPDGSETVNGDLRLMLYAKNEGVDVVSNGTALFAPDSTHDFVRFLNGSDAAADLYGHTSRITAGSTSGYNSIYGRRTYVETTVDGTADGPVVGSFIEVKLSAAAMNINNTVFGSKYDIILSGSGAQANYVRGHQVNLNLSGVSAAIPSDAVGYGFNATSISNHSVLTYGFKAVIDYSAVEQGPDVYTLYSQVKLGTDSPAPSIYGAFFDQAEIGEGTILNEHYGVRNRGLIAGNGCSVSTYIGFEHEGPSTGASDFFMNDFIGFYLRAPSTSGGGVHRYIGAFYEMLNDFNMYAEEIYGVYVTRIGNMLPQVNAARYGIFLEGVELDTSSGADSGLIYAQAEEGSRPFLLDCNAFVRDGGKSVVGPVDFSKTSSAALSNITGLTATLMADEYYSFRAVLFTTSNSAGGIQFAIGGTATATSIVYEAEVVESGVLKVPGTSRAAALATKVGDVTAVTVAKVIIEGTIVVNVKGTITVQFAQNVSNGTASKVLKGSSFIVDRM